jgi:hypothetical protein
MKTAPDRSSFQVYSREKVPPLTAYRSRFLSYPRTPYRRTAHPSIAPANNATSPNVPEIDPTIRCR